MPRKLAPEFKAALDARIVRPVLLLEAFWQSGPMRLCTSDHDISWQAPAASSFAESIGSGYFTFKRDCVAGYIGFDGWPRMVPKHTPRRVPGRGLFLEPSGTNFIRNSTMQGAVVGISSGATKDGRSLPTFWNTDGEANFSPAGGWSCFAVFKSGGFDFASVGVGGKAMTNNGATLYLESGAAVAVAPGDSYCFSAYLAKFGNWGGGNGRSSYDAQMGIEERNAGGGVVRRTFGPTLMALTGSAPVRLDVSAITTGTTRFIVPFIKFNAVSGRLYDFGITIGMPQLERGLVPTSYIPTSGARGERLEDDLVIKPEPGTMSLQLTFEDGDSRFYVNEAIGEGGWRVPPQAKFIRSIQPIDVDEAYRLDFSESDNSHYLAVASIGG